MQDWQIVCGGGLGGVLRRWHGACWGLGMSIDIVIAPGSYWSGRVPRGATLRLVDLEGCQAVDFLCYSADDPTERYSAADTMKVAGSIFIGKGTRLYSDMGNALFTVVEDSCGRHDTIGGCCSRESNRLRYGVEDGPNCRDNFLSGLACFGLGKKDIVANLNFFMSVPVRADGTMAIVEGHSKPGDAVELRAEMDVLVALSNCPQINNPANNFKPTPIQLVIRH
jgi:urea carboxylase-associated protein 1